MRKMLEYQADRIEAVLQQHRVPGRVTGGVVTPRFIRFEVAPALDTRISAIRGLSEELAAALDAPACRVARQGATVVVEVPREKPGVVGFLPLLRGLRAVPPVTAVLGLADDGAACAPCRRSPPCWAWPTTARRCSSASPPPTWPTSWSPAPPAPGRPRCCARWRSAWRCATPARVLQVSGFQVSGRNPKPAT